MALRSSFGIIFGGAKLDGYAATIDGLPGGPPVTHWRLGEGSGAQIVDRKGSRHGTYSGTIGYGATGLPQNSDAAIDLAGAGYGEISHDAGLALSAFSLSFWFQLHEYPSSDGEGREILISKGKAGLFLGDTDIMIEDDGSLTVQFQTASGQHALQGPTVPLNVPHHLVVRADNTGFDAYLNGLFIGKIATYTDAWASADQPLRFGTAPWLFTSGGSWPTNAILLNGILDEIALYARVLAEDEILSLAQYDQSPIANPDLFSVPEEATTIIDPVANDQYAGEKSALTLEVSEEPVSTWGGSVATAHGTATVRADRRIDFLAGSVTQHEADAFNTRITDAFGTSGPALVSLTVQDAAAPSEGDDGRGGTLIYHWEPLAVWIDGVPLANRDTNDVETLSYWLDGANPANGGSRIGHNIPNLALSGAIRSGCWNRAPTGHPSMEIRGITSDNFVSGIRLGLAGIASGWTEWGTFSTNPRHLRMVVEYKHCVSSDPTTYKSQGSGTTTGSYPNFRDSFEGHHSGKYMSGLVTGREAQGACRTNHWQHLPGDGGLPWKRDLAYHATAFGSGGGVRSYSYYYDRTGNCGGPTVSTNESLAQMLSPAFDGKWNRWEYEMKLQDPALVNSSWGGTNNPNGGDGFIRLFVTSDVDGTPGQRVQYAGAENIVIHGSDDNNHVRCQVNGPYLHQYHGGVSRPLIEYWGWIRKVQVYHYPEDDI